MNWDIEGYADAHLFNMNTKVCLLCLRKIWANERRCYMCKTLSHWLRTCCGIESGPKCLSMQFGCYGDIYSTVVAKATAESYGLCMIAMETRPRSRSQVVSSTLRAMYIVLVSESSCRNSLQSFESPLMYSAWEETWNLTNCLQLDSDFDG